MSWMPIWAASERGWGTPVVSHNSTSFAYLISGYTGL